MARLPHLREIPTLLRAAALVCTVRLALWIVPFARLARVVMFLARPRLARQSHYSADQLSWAVRAISRYVPRATCLTQAGILSKIPCTISVSEIGFATAAQITISSRWISAARP